jgi:hypothetical protein
MEHLVRKKKNYSHGPRERSIERDIGRTGAITLTMEALNKSPGVDGRNYLEVSNIERKIAS